MKIVVKKVGQIGKVAEVEGGLETWQEIVGGYITTYPLGQNMLVICNEEGLLMGLKPNLQIGNQVLVGDVAIVKKGRTDFKSLDEAQIKALRKFGLIE